MVTLLKEDVVSFKEGSEGACYRQGIDRLRQKEYNIQSPLYSLPKVIRLGSKLNEDFNTRMCSYIPHAEIFLSQGFRNVFSFSLTSWCEKRNIFSSFGEDGVLRILVWSWRKTYCDLTQSSRHIASAIGFFLI